MTIPSLYREYFAEAKKVDAVLADRYMRHMVLGDPQADALIDALNQHSRNQAHAWVERGIEGGPQAIADAPDSIRSFFADLEHVPEWLDHDLFLPGRQGFHRHSEMFVLAVASAIMIEGFSVSLSQSFGITGRVVDSGVRRLKQNNRHILEIMMPGGLEREADGWKLTVRARLIHARIRNLLANSEEWDAEAWGTPLSASHMAFVNALFSARLLEQVAVLGVDLSEEERESFMAIWRYSGHLMGVMPEFSHASQSEALRLLEIAKLCEPPPSVESIYLANATINSAPLLVGIDDPTERHKVARKVYQLSRGLVGDEMADQLNFPRQRASGLLARMRRRNRIDRFLQNRFPAIARWRRVGQFEKMMDISHYADAGLRYRMPQNVHAEKDRAP